MHEGDRHIIQPVHDYHWNRLSCNRVRELFAPYAQSIQTIHHHNYLSDHFDYHETHNQNAYLMIITL